ncbi:ABC transporter ATP-binding protein [Aquariibacter albus]|uniref:ATP-binding cassette domain-containing protein n=1 Tax=Aquariibacter albus TaxID=2759899 RepID=A0A839HKJ3_9BURK|nr:oligopeptide/dipeptide ABC transporter ATP-binding protein [Aquariibacter albus]MBB1162603.1 ATP-binding cassette domain-containing protein [Aquariibacter albus]
MNTAHAPLGSARVFRPPLIETYGLSRSFDLPRAGWLDPPRSLLAVDKLDLTLAVGSSYGLVGESGSGKSTVARMLVGLLAPSEGEVNFEGDDLYARLRRPGAQALRRRLQMVFQDPQASLNPRWTAGRIVGEPLRLLGDGLGGLDTPADRAARVAELLRLVGLSPDDALRLPHSFSGGQRQRIAIARALASAPDFLVCDEPTSALDMSTQAQVLALLADLRAMARGMTQLFISHNLAVVRHMCDSVGVMYLGRLVEEAPAARIFQAPRHPYTRQLVAAVPDPARRGRARLLPIGEAPDPSRPPAGCAFHPRCSLANERCRAERPVLRRLEADSRVACHAVQEGRA